MPNICPVCGHENLVGALICAKCYSLLVHVDPQDSTTLLPHEQRPKAAGEVWEQAPPPARRITLESPDTIALYIGDRGDPLILQVGNQAILGRYTPHSISQPRVDLTPYGAFDKGVSRMHVMLRRTPEGLVVEDLASSNGTWLNGVRLQPYTPQRLKSGDRLRLSQLEIEVQLGNGES